MSSQTTLIKEKLPIVDVVSSYIKLEQFGKNYKAKCPFHNEKTPSFFVSPDRASYYCFGCNAKGDIFSFVEQFEGTDFLGALKILAERAGVKLESKSYQSKDETEKLYEIMEEATKYFESVFEKETAPRAYLVSRGLKDETIKLFRIGYAPSSWRTLGDYLNQKGFSNNELEKVGLIKKGNSGFYDRFRARIIFPISDSSGRVIAFSGRIFYLPNENTKTDIEEAKYLNSPDTPLFKKSHVLFGIDKAKNAIRTRGYSIIVEGQIDIIMSHQAGFTNTVAVSGTAFSDTTSTTESKINNLGLVRRLSPNIIFTYDGDDAGVRAAGRSAMIALALDMQVKVAVLPVGKDPADLILEDIEQWKQIIKNATNIVSFHLDKICEKTSDMRIRGRLIREIIFPYLIMIKSSIEKSSYITEIHGKTGIPEKAIIEDFGKYESSNIRIQNKEMIITENKISRRDLLLSRLFGILFWQSKEKDAEEKINESQEELAKIIGKEKLEELRKLQEPLTDTLSFEAEMWYGGKKDTALADIDELVLNIGEEILQEKLYLLLDEINKKNAPKEILEEYQKIIRNIEEIKSRRAE